MNENNVEYLTIPEAAEAAEITIRTLHNWLKDDMLKSKKGIKHGRRRKLILKADLQAVT